MPGPFRQAGRWPERYIIQAAGRRCRTFVDMTELATPDVRLRASWFEGNIASRRTIERNGGVYEDSRQGRRRYWIDVAPGVLKG
jgi:hypothetical protein